MELTKELYELAQFSAGTLPVVSVYLNTQWRDQHQRPRALAFLHNHLQQARELVELSADAQQSLNTDLQYLTTWSERHLQGTAAPEAPGHALFLCSAAGLQAELPAPVPFEDEFAIADRPTLRQLARLDEDYTNALVVMIDSRSARIYEVVLGGVALSRVDFSNTVPGRHKQGGWAQMRYQRHVRDRIDQHHKEVAAYVSAYIEEHPRTQVILSGQNPIVANFRGFLATPVTANLIDTLSLDIQDTRQHVLAAAQEALVRHEREEEQQTLEQLLNRAGHGGLAVLGQQATVEAANAGKVHQLVLNRDMHAQGWRCLVCSRIGEGSKTQCPGCGGAVAAVELGEALVSAVLSRDGFIEQIEPDERLRRYEGVGALLRYR